MYDPDIDNAVTILNDHDHDGQRWELDMIDGTLVVRSEDQIISAEQAKALADEYSRPTDAEPNHPIAPK